MLERFYDPQEGSVMFDGVDVKKLDPMWYHKHVALVQQEPFLFSGTILENIVYGLEGDYTQQQLEEACKMANAFNFIQDPSTFPEGFDTIVGERGVRLSGG